MSGLSWKERFQINQLCRAADQVNRTQNDREGASRLLGKALKISSQDERTFLAKARLEFEGGNLDEALTLARKAIRHSKDTNPACFLLSGEILFAQKQYGDARKAFQKVLELDSRNGLAKNFLAFCHLQEGRTEDFKKTLAEEGLWHRSDLIRIAWTQRKIPIWDLHQQAREKSNPKTNLPPVEKGASVGSRISYARKAIGKGIFKAAFDALRPVVKDRAKDAAFIELFAEASARAGEGQEARELLENLIKQAKGKIKEPFIFFLLGQCCHNTADYTAAVEAYRQGEPFTNMPYYAAMFEYYAAISHLGAKEYAKAGEAIEKACRIDPLLASLIAVSLTGLLCRGEPLRELIDEE